MKKIYKYQITNPDHIEFQIPRGAQILTVQMQIFPTIWALVDSEADLVVRRFVLIMTGEEIISSTELRYIGTVQKGTNWLEDQVIVVGHLFEDLR